jgi:hypothetical protein
MFHRGLYSADSLEFWGALHLQGQKAGAYERTTVYHCKSPAVILIVLAAAYTAKPITVV